MSYPILTEMVLDLLADNGCVEETPPESQWQWPSNVVELETMASHLTQDERDLLTIGEEGERRSLVERKSLQPLDNFFTSIFNQP